MLLSFVSGLVTGLGALIVIMIRNPSKKLMSWSLGFASGVMIGISTLSLIPESIETGSLYSCLGGFVFGAFFMWVIDVALPHVYKTDTEHDFYMKMGSFIALGIAFHNVPEGIAIGASHHVSAELGTATALSIGIHNIAEGLSVAMPLSLGKMGKTRIVFITTMTGLATLLGTVIGVNIVAISEMLISFSLAFAAGAMLYICSDELIPQSHGTHSHAANLGIIMGIMLAVII